MNDKNGRDKVRNKKRRRESRIKVQDMKEREQYKDSEAMTRKRETEVKKKVEKHK